MKKQLTVASYALTATKQSITLRNGRKSVVPEITCTDDNTVVEFGEISLNLGKGTHKVLDIYLKQGNNVLAVSGSGTITFAYKEGEL